MDNYDLANDNVFDNLCEPEYTDETFDELTNGRGDE